MSAQIDGRTHGSAPTEDNSRLEGKIMVGTPTPRKDRQHGLPARVHGQDPVLPVVMARFFEGINNHGEMSQEPASAIRPPASKSFAVGEGAKGHRPRPSPRKPLLMLYG